MHGCLLRYIIASSNIAMPQSYVSQPDWDCVIFEESKTFLGELFSSGVQFRIIYDDDSLTQQLKPLLPVLNIALFLRILSS